MKDRSAVPFFAFAVLCIVIGVLGWRMIDTLKAPASPSTGLLPTIESSPSPWPTITPRSTWTPVPTPTNVLPPPTSAAIAVYFVRVTDTPAPTDVPHPTETPVQVCGRNAEKGHICYWPTWTPTPAPAIAPISTCTGTPDLFPCTWPR